jgi:hypothetical protein
VYVNENHISGKKKKLIIINPRTRHNIIATTCQFSKNFKQTGIQQIFICAGFYKVNCFFLKFSLFQMNDKRAERERGKT